MRSHVIHICVVALISLMGLAAFNWLVNPYNIWNAPDIYRVNTYKNEMERNERIFKTVGLARTPANAVILGTSRSDVGLSPNHISLGDSAINLAISGQPYRETRMLFDMLADRKVVKTVVIGMDFFAANIYYPTPKDFVVDNYSTYRSWQLMFSGYVLVDSIGTVEKSFANRKLALWNMWSEKGLHLWSPEFVRVGGGARKLMRDNEKSYIRTYSPEPWCTFKLDAERGGVSPLEEIRTILFRAHQERIAVKLLISPSHARQWETLASAGQWDKWEEWKKRLVIMNEEEALRAGQEPFPLWDFSGYNSITTEIVPAPGDAETLMRWYSSDSSHYNRDTGDLVLDRVFNVASPARAVPGDFGTLLTSRNIDAHLANIRTAREHYRHTHSADVAEIESMAKAVADTKHCNGESKRTN